jgi:hypothetical protein
MFLARADVVAVLLARLSPVEDLDRSRPVGERTLRHHAERWERLRFVERRRLLGFAWFLPTRRGLAFAGVDFPPYAPVGQRLAHQHATAVVRLAVEAQYPGLEWVCERELAARRKASGGRWHRPDGLADTTLVEVELTRKKPEELQRHLLEPQHPAGRTRVYFAPARNVDTLAGRVAGIQAGAARGSRGPVWVPTDVRPLPEVAGVSYNGVR